jgi:hypothetical protein
MIIAAAERLSNGKFEKFAFIRAANTILILSEFDFLVLNLSPSANGQLNRCLPPARNLTHGYSTLGLR